jgi:hypothetical protein
VNGISLPVYKALGSDKSTLFLVSNFTCFGKLSTDSTICSGRGICVNLNKCSCTNFAYGDQCENVSPFKCFGLNATDPNVCSGNGNCVYEDVCTCNSLFSGLACDTVFDDTVTFSFGKNSDGQLGIGSTTDALSPTKVPINGSLITRLGYDHSFLMKNLSNIFMMGKNSVRKNF